jgi:scyllo-inositol 2-dehydrogenase (NADP+)
MLKSNKSDGKDDLRVALIGYGLAGSVFHAPLISCTEGLLLKAIVTSNAERQAGARADFPDAEVVSAPEEIIRRADEYDLLVIASPNNSHAPLAMAGLESGLNLVIDKPMGISVAECQQLVATSRKQEKLLTVFQNRRWDADFLTISLLLRSNSLGSINRLESRFERWRPVPRANSWRELGRAADGGGILFDLGAHLIDQALTLFGRPETVYAEMNARRPGVASDDDCFVALTFAGGITAHLWMSHIARKSGARFRLCGMQGTFEKFGLDPQEDALRAGRRPNTASWGSEPSDCWGTIASERDGLHYEGRVETLHGDYPAFYKQMRDAMRGLGPVPVDPMDGVLTLQVIEAARMSARQKVVVELEIEPDTVSG